MAAEQTKIIKDGLWSNNVALVQLLGLCPLLAVTGSFINGLGLGLATMMTLILSNTCVSLIRHWTRPEVRIPIFVLIIASIVTSIELAMNAWFHELYLVLGIFIPLIVTNCSIIARAEAFASRNTVLDSALDGFMMGLGFLLVLVTLGSLREIIGQGSLFANAHLMFGEAAAHIRTHARRKLPGIFAGNTAARCIHRSRPVDRTQEYHRPPQQTKAGGQACWQPARQRLKRPPE